MASSLEVLNLMTLTTFYQTEALIDSRRNIVMEKDSFH
jgi:hypothetical protein